MKKAFLFSLFLFFIIGCNKDDDSTNATSNYVGDVWLRTQKEVEDFGKMGYSSVEGTICIGCVSENDIDDLSSLKTLRNVKTLEIQYNTVLRSLEGLDNLTDVDNLLISGNSLLNNIDIFDSLESFKTLEIINTRLLHINLESLRTPEVPPSVTIIGNPILESINLNNLTHLFSLEFSRNRDLLNIQVGALTKIEDNFTIENCSKITSIAFNNLTELNGYSKIKQNPSLETFEANNLVKAEDLVIDENYQLTAIEFSNLSNLKSLTLRGSRVSVLNLESLQNRAEPTSLFIKINYSLTDVNFGNMTIAKDVRFDDNQSLTNLDLGNLSKIEGSLYIVNSDLISDLNFENLTEVVDMRISGNFNLETFIADNITQVGVFEIDGSNYDLTTISMDNLGVVTDKLTIRDFGPNSYLTNLDGFTSLFSVEELIIFNNDHLKDFCGITNLITNGNVGAYDVSYNGYNPTQQDIIDGNCSI